MSTTNISLCTSFDTLYEQYAEMRLTIYKRLLLFIPYTLLPENKQKSGLNLRASLSLELKGLSILVAPSCAA